MQVTINDTILEVPFDTEVITLQEFINYQNEYGKDLDKKLKEILEKKYSDEDEHLRVLALEEHLDLEALCWYSYWTKFDLLECRDHPFITPLLHQYRILRYLLKDNDEELVFPIEFEWKGEQWAIQDFKINPASEMSFNEIITSKEVMRQVLSIGGNKWDGMIYLCAVYCRKKGEEFTDALVQEGSERMEELKELPLKYALQISFFLSACARIWLNTLAYSVSGEQGTPSLN